MCGQVKSTKVMSGYFETVNTQQLLVVDNSVDAKYVTGIADVLL